jgi:subtilisin family serine protease
MKTSIREAFEIAWEDLARMDLAPVDVAILDSGIDATHPALVGRIVEAYGVETIDGRERVVALSNDADNDLFGHGTSVGSIVARVAPNARLYDVRVLGRSSSGGEEILCKGLKHSVDHRWPVLNLSLAAGYRMRGELQALCDQAYYRSQTVIAARRNLPVGGDGLPAEFSACIGVDLGGYEAPFHFGFREGFPIELVAGGEGVTAAVRGGGWTTVTGTSFATPAVSGLCVLLLGAFPDLQPYEIKSILRFRAVREAAERLNGR